MFLGDLSDLSRNVACDLKAPSLVEVSSENFVLMYPFQLATVILTKMLNILLEILEILLFDFQTISDTTALGESFVEADRLIRARQNNGAKTNNNRVDHIKADKGLQVYRHFY